jgi:ABC-type antimicrobial peptide transport system permease subunit
MRPRGPEETLKPEVFIPLLQTAESTAELMVRTDPGPLSIAPALRAAVRAVMPARQIQEQTLEQHYATLLAERKFNMMILAIFGVVAIMVAAIGIYGLMAFVVAQRRREIGVRVALGAAPAGILRMVLRSALALMLAGLCVGVAAALLLEQTIRAFLFQPQQHDPAIYAGAALVLLLAGLAAALGPARRAARVDPLVALRMD